MLLIPDRRLRRIVAGTLAFAVSLAVGWLVEVSLNEEALKDAQAAQARLIRQTAAFTPFRLVQDYWTIDVDAVMHGEWVHDAGARKKAAEEQAARDDAVRDMVEQRDACARARIEAGLRPSRADCARLAVEDGVSQMTCTLSPGTAGCARHDSCIAGLDEPFTLSAECLGTGINPLPFPLTPPDPEAGSLAPVETGFAPKGWLLAAVPIGAVVHGATRLASGGPGAALLALGQAGLGLLAFLALSAALSPRGRAQAGFGNVLANVILIPVCVLGLGSLIALGLQGLMLGALHLFHGVTSFAATAAGVTGAAGVCWLCVKKLAEQGIEKAVKG
jgi:hypothetical protein